MQAVMRKAATSLVVFIICLAVGSALALVAPQKAFAAQKLSWDNADVNVQTIKLNSNGTYKQLNGYKGGKAVKPKVTVTYKNKTLKAGKDYTLTYKNNKNIGMAQVVIKGKGSYSGTMTSHFQVVPQALKSVKAKAVKKGVKVSWKAASAKQADGYFITVVDKNNKIVKNVTIKNRKTTSKTITGLKAKTKYTVYVRAYNVTNDVLKDNGGSYLYPSLNDGIVVSKSFKTK